MTTRVIVTTGDHPAAVLAFPLKDGEPVGGAQYSQLGVVEPNATGEFVAHSGQDILVREEALPVAAAQADAQTEEVSSSPTASLREAG
ncbi:MAG: hypothetical protein CL949_12745 [Erythrobacter sp.]|nr:hypothetical protein [Erythrobacter sp.]|tara:strand:- start:119 stop:382 length:264 start_codon:yes stop_codon:yes gene_type:complete